MERVSNAIFGRACRLAVGLWILNEPKGRFYQSQPPETLAARTAIRQELDRFVEAGLLDVERPDGQARVYYVRTDSALWDVFRAADIALGMAPH